MRREVLWHTKAGLAWIASEAECVLWPARVSSVSACAGQPVFRGHADGQDGAPRLHCHCRCLPHSTHHEVGTSSALVILTIAFRAVQCCRLARSVQGRLVQPVVGTSDLLGQVSAHATDWGKLCLGRYIQAFQGGFDEGLKHVQLSFMQSDGGLSPVSSFSGHKAVLSGPAGGYVGVSDTTSSCSCLALVTFLVSGIPGFVIYHVHA